MMRLLQTPLRGGCRRPPGDEVMKTNNNPDAAAAVPDLRVAIGRQVLRNPVMTASGTFGYGPEYAELVDYNRLGALVTKGISLVPWDGNPAPRLVEVRGGLVNAIGLQNPGAETFCREYLPFLRRYDVPVIVNVWGRTVAEYERVVQRLGDEPGIAGLEINISCPNIKQGGASFSATVKAAAAVMRAVRKRAATLIMPKLPPNVPDIAAYARMAQEEGADAVSLINTLPAMVIDIETRRPVLGNVTGGLSGPAVHPVAVKLVYEAAAAVRIPVVAMGGITTPADAIEFIVAGAAAVAVGSAHFTEPSLAPRIADGIAAYLRRHGIARVKDLTGSVIRAGGESARSS